MSAGNTAKLNLMALMQEKFNSQVHSQWHTQGFEYYRAIWIECAELIDHYGWKWWKHQELDLNQVKLELVDIWHFGLSDLIRAGKEEDAAQAFDRADVDAENFCLAVEAFAHDTLTTRRFSATAFGTVLASLPMSFDELFDLYVGKNVLNKFRQDHGYKSGEYKKVWAGREDNEHLVELLAGLDVQVERIPTELYALLLSRYQDAR